MHSGGRCASRVRHRTSIQTNPLWIHEWDRTDGADQPSAQVFRLLGRGRRPFAGIVDHWRAHFGWKANWTAFAIGVGTLAAILLLKNSTRFSGTLVAVVGATAIVGMLDLAARANVSVLGPLPQGLPTFAIPWIAYSDIVPVLIGGCAVALISFADTSILSRTYAARLGTKVDPNQEMVGLGAANVAAGFFTAFRSAAVRHGLR